MEPTGEGPAGAGVSTATVLPAGGTAGWGEKNVVWIKKYADTTTIESTTASKVRFSMELLERVNPLSGKSAFPRKN